jgi:hypothetical protein
MKKLAAVIFVIALLAGGTAFAEDGVKAYIGYGIGGQYNTITGYDSANGTTLGKDHISGLIHGPSLDVRYEGIIFARVMSDYYFFADNDIKSGGNKTHISNGYQWSVEGDLGYRIYNKNNLSLNPYLGFGYSDWRVRIAADNRPKLEFNTPYGVAGFFVKYEVPQWSVGFDAAGLVPFSGKYKTGDDTGSTGSATTNVGWGARAQVPITFTILPKKNYPVGIMIFATPFYQYLDSMKSRNWDGEKIKYDTHNYGIKVGLGFAF